MTNKIFSGILWTFFVITSLFLILPLAVLIYKGMGYIIPSLVMEEVIFSIGMSLKTTLISTIMCLIFAIPTSITLHQHKSKFKKIFTIILYLPMSLPHLVSGIALLIFFGNMGIGKFLFSAFNFDFIFTKWGIVLAQTFVSLPFTIKMISTCLEDTNDKMIFVSRTLGCNSYQAFKYVTLPSLKRGILSAAIMTWSKSLGEFGAVLMVAGSTRLKTETLPTAIFLNMATGDMNTAIGISVILIIISLVCMGTFEFLTRNKPKVTEE